MRVSSLLVLLLVGHFCSNSLGSAQGTVLFSNIGSGVSAPVSVDGLSLSLRGDYSAELFVRGKGRIAGPTPFVINGWFTGGVAVVPEVAPGSVAELILKVTKGGSAIWESDALPTVLGGGSLGSSANLNPPAVLQGLGTQPIDIRSAPNCRWAIFAEFDFGATGPVVCQDVGSGALAFVETDRSCCEGLPLPHRYRQLKYRRTRTGRLEIRWFQNPDLALYCSSDITRVDAKLVRAGKVGVVNVDPSNGMKVYWLGPAVTEIE